MAPYIIGLQQLLAYPNVIVNIWKPFGTSPGRNIVNNMLIQYGNQHITNVITTTIKDIASLCSFFWACFSKNDLLFNITSVDGLRDFLSVTSLHVSTIVSTSSNLTSLHISVLVSASVENSSLGTDTTPVAETFSSTV